MSCGHGGTGRRARLRGVWATVWVQFPLAAPKKQGFNSPCFFYVFMICLDLSMLFGFSKMSLLTYALSYITACMTYKTVNNVTKSVIHRTVLKHNTSVVTLRMKKQLNKYNKWSDTNQKSFRISCLQMGC